MSYSHMETPHYHRRYCVSLLSSAWNQVGPQCYGRQANFKIRKTDLKSLSNSFKGLSLSPQNPFGCCMDSPHGQLVQVSSMPRSTYTLPYQRRSLRQPFRTLIVPGKTHLKARFPLRCFQRLSIPNLATGQCHWHDPNTRGSSSVLVLELAFQFSNAHGE